MSLRIKGNPFLAGTGNKPPHLAGRQREKSEIDFALDLITGQTDKYGSLDGTSPYLVLIGPRGVGKTTLLEWTRRRAMDLRVDCAVLTEELLAGPGDELGEAILGEEEYELAASEITASGKLGHSAVTILGMEGELKLPAAVLSLRALLNRKLKSKPLLVILDEAHAVAPELFKKFCITTQRFLQESRPLALVLAGTPGLRGAIRGVGATFMERSRFMSLNLLTVEEAREALSVPASDTGVPIDEDALETLVEWTDCYPFFIQLAGEAAWDIAKGRESSKITMEDAKQAMNEAGKLRRDFYNSRLNELVEMNIVPYAMQAIELFERLTDGKMDYLTLVDETQQANEGMAQERAVEITKMLLNIGFIYENGENCEPGIPSLFDYVKEKIHRGANGNK